MTFTVSGKEVRTANGRRVKLPFPVRKAVEMGGLLVVLLDVPVRKDYPRNVLAIDEAGTVAWQVAQVPTPVHHGCFIDLWREGDAVRARHFDCWEYDLDPVDGRILRSVFTK